MIQQMRTLGLNSDLMYVAAIVSVLLSILAWFLVRGEDRSTAERFGIFVGLWAPTLMVLGKVLEDAERAELAA